MIYGDQLSFFSEQFRFFEYFTMEPDTVASYSQRKSLGRVKGVFQYWKKGELKREEDTLADVDVPTIWTRQTLKAGNYFIQKDDETYRIVNKNDWTFEGGFNVYVLELMVGSTDEQQPFTYVDLGQNSYD